MMLEATSLFIATALSPASKALARLTKDTFLIVEHRMGEQTYAWILFDRMIHQSTTFQEMHATSFFTALARTEGILMGDNCFYAVTERLLARMTDIPYPEASYWEARRAQYRKEGTP
jgi:hypothetical protein